MHAHQVAAQAHVLAKLQQQRDDFMSEANAAKADSMKHRRILADLQGTHTRKVAGAAGDS